MKSAYCKQSTCILPSDSRVISPPNDPSAYIKNIFYQNYLAKPRSIYPRNFNLLVHVSVIFVAIILAKIGRIDYNMHA